MTIGSMPLPMEKIILSNNNKCHCMSTTQCYYHMCSEDNSGTIHPQRVSDFSSVLWEQYLVQQIQLGHKRSHSGCK